MNTFVDQTTGERSTISEMAHGKQMKNNPLEFYLAATASYLRIFSKGGFNADKLKKAQGEEYDIRGSLENEVHSVIEPQLDQHYKKLTKLRGISENEVTRHPPTAK